MIDHINNLPIFDYDDWFIRLDTQISAFKFIYKKLSTDERESYNKIIKEIQKKANKNQTSPKQEVNNYPNEGLRFLPEEINDLQSVAHIPEALDIYSRQMIVIADSYIENIIEDFAFCVFCKHPRRMNEYLSQDNNSQKGKISLNEVLNAGNMDELIQKLALSASSNITKGGFKVMIKRLEKITNNKISTVKLSQLDKIIVQRNEIVHELSETPIDPKEIENIYTSVKDFLGHLTDIAQSLDIPIEKTAI